MKSNEMICEPLGQVFHELNEERKNFEYFKELDQRWLSQTIQMVIRNTGSYFNSI